MGDVGGCCEGVWVMQWGYSSYVMDIYLMIKCLCTRVLV